MTAVNRNEDLARQCQRRRLRLRNGAPNLCAAALSSQTSVALFAGNSGQLGFFDRLRRLSVGMHSSFDLGVRKGVAVPCSPCHMIHKNEKENQPCPSAARPRCRLMHGWLKAIPPPSAATLTMPFPLSAAGKTLDLPPVNLRVLPCIKQKMHSLSPCLIGAVLPSNGTRYGVSICRIPAGNGIMLPQMPSGFLCKAGVAAAAGDGHDPLAPGQTEPRLAAGAAEVFVLLAVFETVLRLTQLGLGAGV